MFNRRLSGSAIVLGMLATCANAPAADRYRVDPVHSTVHFRIKHLNVSYFYGRFNDPTGTITFDEQDPAQISFEVEIAAAKVDTNNANRDKDLRSPNFFDAEQFPTIRFKSTQVKKGAERAYEVTGELTLHGITKPVAVRIEHVGTGPGMRGEVRAGFESTFTIKRTDFGMDKMLGGVGDEVKLMIGLEAIRE